MNRQMAGFRDHVIICTIILLLFGYISMRSRLMQFFFEFEKFLWNPLCSLRAGSPWGTHKSHMRAAKPPRQRAASGADAASEPASICANFFTSTPETAGTLISQLSFTGNRSLTSLRGRLTGTLTANKPDNFRFIGKIFKANFP